MAVNIEVSISKKVPGDQQYSSNSASITIITESKGNPVKEAEELFQTAEGIVDQQLGIDQLKKIDESVNANSFNYNGSVPNFQAQVNGNGRRSKPATENQLKLLQRLMSKDPIHSDSILAKFNVDHIDELNISQASAAIDQLKART